MKESASSLLSSHRREKAEIPAGIEVLQPPGLELFLAGFGEESSLPKEVATNPEVLRQAVQRRELYQTLKKSFDKLNDPDLSITEAVSKNIFSSEEAAGIYNKLSSFIETDENNSRIILYLPFQILPDFSHSAISGFQRLDEAQRKFGKICRLSWIRLLHESEPRATYTNGDILEESLGEAERIRKAGHLTPELLYRGIISQTDIADILEISEDGELLRSITEGVVVARDRNLIDPEIWEKLMIESEVKPEIADVLTKSAKGTEIKFSVDEDINALNTGNWMKAAEDYLGMAINKADDKFVPGSEYAGKVSQARIKWERYSTRNQIIDQVAEQIAFKLHNREVNIADLENLSSKPGLFESYPITGIRSIMLAAEKIAGENPGQAKVFIQEYESFIQILWDSESAEIQDAIKVGLTRLRRLNVIGDETVNKFNIRILDLASPFPVNRETIIHDFNYLIDASKKIKDHPMLSKYIYPFFVVFGSRVKGYAYAKADYDSAIFIKPGVDPEKRNEIMETLKRDVPEMKNTEKLLEYWITEENGRYGMRSSFLKGRVIVGALQVHFLWNGVWLGQGEDMKKFHDAIVKKYLDLNRFEEDKEEARNHVLGQVEMDIVQYRLMHKGYKRNYPQRRSQGTKHSYMIDGESDYWDPAYRRIASLIFISRVFIPDLDLGKDL